MTRHLHTNAVSAGDISLILLLTTTITQHNMIRMCISPL